MLLVVKGEVECDGCGKVAKAHQGLSCVPGLPAVAVQVELPDGWEHRQVRGGDAQLLCHRCRHKGPTP